MKAVHARRQRLATRGLVLAVLVLAAAAAGAHVGSPNVFYEGTAGDYPIRVIIRPPGVIPGLAEIAVRADPEVEGVEIRLFRWDVGDEGAPPAESAVRVPGDDELWSAELWLMTSGAHSVEVTVRGPKSDGSVLVPFESVRRETLEMESWYAAGLLGMGLFLFVGALTILGASARESTLEPGESPDSARVRLGRVVIVIGAALFGFMLWGGWDWWAEIDNAYRNAIYEPMRTKARVESIGDARVLEIEITDRRWTSGRTSPLVPDHGKLMHTFLVRDDLSAFAHVHPVRSHESRFRLQVPDLPAGRYRIYSDVVHESGFSQTLVDNVRLPERREATEGRESDTEVPPADADDSWTAGIQGTDSVALGDGVTMTWQRPAEPIAVDEDITLAFAVTDADGAAVQLEPYMGMLAHSAITLPDGEVFVHLHPSGSISMGSLQVERARRDIDPGHADMHHTGQVSFPYAFPRSGDYRMWVQVKYGDTVRTGNFAVNVE